MLEKTGSEILIEMLARHHITTVAGIPGGYNLPLYDALALDGRIAHILARHEQGAAFMAQGMTRSSGTPAACIATSGPGATNLLTGIADAYADSVPIICITGQVPQAMLGTEAFQEVDICAMATPVTKKTYLVKDAHELLTVVPEAFAIAAEGRPGPVLIDIPKDVQLQRVKFSSWPLLPAQAKSDDLQDDEDSTAFHEAALHEAAHLINAAHRPLLYLGGGVNNPETAETIHALAHKARIPAVSSLMGLGVMRSDDGLFLGMLGMHGASAVNMAVDQCDLLIGLGARFDDRATGKLSGFAPNARILQLDIAPRQLHRKRRADAPLLGDAKEILASLLPFVIKRERREWLSEIAQMRDAYPVQVPAATQMVKTVIERVAAALPDSYVTTDVGQHQMWTAQYYPFTRPRQLLTSGGIGTMGFGLPAAIGAALRNPDAPIICMSGDGSLLMNIQELAVMAEHRLNIKLVLFDNQSLGLVCQQQDLFFGQRRHASEFINATDFEQIANGFGIDAVSIDTDEIDRFDALLQSDGPMLLRVPVDREAHVLPIVPPGKDNTEMMVSAPAARRSVRIAG